MKGIKNILEALDLLITLADVGLSVSKDGKVGVDDMGQLLKLIPVLGPAIDDFKEIALEAQDLDGEEGKQIVAHVAAKLVIEDAKAKAIILAAFDALLAGQKLFLAIKG